MDLEGQLVALAGLDAIQGLFPGAGQAAEGVVLCRVEGVDADAGAHRAGGLERLHALVGERHAIGAHHHRQAAPGAMGHQFFQVGAHQRLAAGEHHHGFGAAAGDLVQQAAHLCRGELVFTAVLQGLCVHVAMGAAEVAAVGQVDREQE